MFDGEDETAIPFEDVQKHIKILVAPWNIALSVRKQDPRFTTAEQGMMVERYNKLWDRMSEKGRGVVASKLDGFRAPPPTRPLPARKGTKEG